MNDFFRAVYEPLLKLENPDAPLIAATYMFIVFMGLAVGSFLNVCIFRGELGMSISKEPSHCMKCGAKLRAIDNVPLFSWIFLRGKCHFCGGKISARYPIVEGLNLLCYLITFSVFDVNPKSVLLCVAFSLLIVIGFIDWDTLEISTGMLIALGVIGIASAFLSKDPATLYEGLKADLTAKERVIGALCVSVPFFIIGECSAIFLKQRYYDPNSGEPYVKTRGVELGDTALMFAGGVLIGWRAIVFSGFLGVILAAFCGIVYKKVTGGSKFAFGPFLAAAIFAGALWGDDFVRWYIERFLTFDIQR